jgi:hypothetical protein
MTRHKLSRPSAHILLLCALTLAAVPTASASGKEKVLYSFQGGANDGAIPAVTDDRVHTCS